MRTRVKAVLGVLALLLLPIAYRMAVALEERRPIEESRRHSLYLPTGDSLRHVTLGFRTLVADYLFVWSIQYYSVHREDRWMHLSRLYDVITDLDPRFLTAYDIGAVILSWEARSPREGIKLLERGMERNPEVWWLPFEAGMYARMDLRDGALALRYIERAKDIPGAPGWVERWYYHLSVNLGELTWRDELEYWLTKFDRETATNQERFAADRKIEQLTMRIQVEELNEAVSRFRASKGRLPRSLDELVEEGVVRHIPLSPYGDEYLYDSESGEVAAPSSMPAWW